MSELTREKKCQIAALGAKGKTVEEIAQTAGIDVETVREFLSARSSEKKPLFGGNKKITTKTIAKINELRQQGKTHKEIADKLGIGTATVNRYLHKDKPSQINKDFDQAVDEMIAETKKEPAPAATDTDSEMKNEIKHISTNNDSIDLDVCQDALERAEKTMITIYNTMSEAEQRAWDLGEAFAEMMRARGQFV